MAEVKVFAEAILMGHPRSGLAILLCHEALFYLRQVPVFLKSNPLSRLSRSNVGEQQRDPPARFSDYIHLALGIDLAVEIPLIIAMHPATLLSSTSFRTPVPSIIQIILQMLVLWGVERSIYHWIKWCLLSGQGQIEGSLETPEQIFEPFRLAMEFMLPRGTLLIAAAGLGVPSMLTHFTGKFHVISVIAWVTLRQLQPS